jgi:putative solute:sodium symporter small subunit
MIEAFVGLLALAAGLAVADGLGGSHIPVPLSFTSGAAIAGLGLVLLAHGVYRIRRNRIAEPAQRHALRGPALAWTLSGLALATAIVIPLFAPLLDAISLTGFPLGFYLAAQGIPLALAILMFRFAASADAIDEAEDMRED